MSDLFKVKAKDFGRGAFNAVFLALIAGFLGVMGDQFDLFTADWAQIGKTMANVGFIAFVGYIQSVYISDKEGKVLGKM